jgi:hypothetical protein
MASQTTSTFEKTKTWDRLKNNAADLVFLGRFSSEFPRNLAHAIAAQTHRDTKAMARAKSQPPSPNYNERPKSADFRRLLVYLMGNFP